MANTKSTVDEIRARFDADVERFANLSTGQAATMDARLQMDLVVRAAAAVTPHAKSLLDVGCGAGNFSLAMLEKIPNLEVTLVDLSRPMLERAQERVGVAASDVHVIQTDLREARFGENRFDIILAAAVLHHLRTLDEVRSTFQILVNALRPQGCLWIFDLVTGASTEIEALMQSRYGEYLAANGGEEYRDKVFAYIEKEDTPWPLHTQMRVLEDCGLVQLDVLHKNACFASFGGVKRS